MKIIMSLILVLSFSSLTWANEAEVIAPGEVLTYDGETLSFGDEEAVTETFQCAADEKPVVKCQKIKKPSRKCPGQRTCNGHKGKFCWPKDRRCPLS